MGFQLPLPTSLNWCNRVYQMPSFQRVLNFEQVVPAKAGVLQWVHVGAVFPVDTMWRNPPRPRVHIPPNREKRKIIDSKVALGGICDRSQEGIALYFRPANLELTTFSWLFLNRPKEQRNASFCWYVDRTHWYVRSVGTEKHHWFEGLLPQEITSKNDAREMSPPLKYGWNRS